MDEENELDLDVILDDKLRQAGLIQNLMYQVKSFLALKFPIIEVVVCT